MLHWWYNEFMLSCWVLSPQLIVNNEEFCTILHEHFVVFVFGHSKVSNHCCTLSNLSSILCADSDCGTTEYGVTELSSGCIGIGETWHALFKTYVVIICVVVMVLKLAGWGLTKCMNP